MNLEIITWKPTSKAHPTPLLFVHGAWHGAWCWDEHFLPYFAEHGYESHALSLRGHGQSECDKRFSFVRIMDYVADVAQVAGQLSMPPVLIGHSMGGLVVQKYLEQSDAPAGVLLASVPTTGLTPILPRAFVQSPLPFIEVNLKLNLYPLVSTPERARHFFFSSDMPEEQNRRYFERIQGESYLTFPDMVLLALPRPKRVKTPLLVLGAAQDTFFTPPLVEKTARAYGVQAEIFPDMAHDMMLEAGWQKVADRILEWLKGRGI